MKQPIYLVALKDPDPEKWEVVRRNFNKGRNYIIDDKVAFIAPEQPTSTGEISHRLGLTSEGGGTGFVLFVGAPVLMAGRHNSDLWEWVRYYGSN